MSVTLNPQGLDFVQYKLAEKFVVRNMVAEGLGRRGWCMPLKPFLSITLNVSPLCAPRNKGRRRWPPTTKQRSPSRSWRPGSGSSTPEWGTSFSLICTRSVLTLFLSIQLSKREWLWKIIRGEVVCLLSIPRAMDEIETGLAFLFPPRSVS